MKAKGTDQMGSIRVVLALVTFVGITLGLVYFAGGRDVDVAEVGDTVAEDLSRAAARLQETSEDALTTAKVKTALAISKSVAAFDINVDSQQGIVTLQGAVPSTAVESAALEIARDTSGVVEVVDRLEIDPGFELGVNDEKLTTRLADAEIKALVYERFLRAGDLDAKGIEVIVNDRVVTLIGTVSNESAAKRAGEIAGSVEGAQSVRNNLSSAGTSPYTGVTKPD